MSLRRFFPISYRVAVIGAASVLVTAAALMLLVVYQSANYSVLAQTEVNGIIDNHLDNTAKSIYNLVKTAHDDTQEKLETDIRVSRSILSRSGNIRLGDRFHSWTVTDQLTSKRREVQLPQLFLGDAPLVINANPSADSPFIDEVAAQTGGTVTLFQRMNESGDMLRVSTNVINGEGQRAIGTYIPAVLPDGTRNRVIDSVLANGTFEGRAWVVDAWYCTAYEAIYGAANQVVGMIYVGIPQKRIVGRIQKVVTETRVGRNGYVYIIEGSGQNRGSYVVSRAGERDDENLWESKDGSGRYIIRDIVNTAARLRPGEMDTVTYFWQNPGDSEPQLKIARLAYFAPWDWVIGTSVNVSELQAYRTYLTRGRHQMLWTMAISTAMIVFLMVALSVVFALRITRPIQSITQIVRSFLKGDAQAAIVSDSRDEIEILSAAFNLMMKSLNETLDGLRTSEAKFRMIFENAMEGIFQTSLDGTIRNVNGFLAAMMGYDSPEDMKNSVVSLSADCYRRPEDRAEFVRELIDKGSVISREVQLRKKSGEFIWASITARLIPGDGAQPPFIEGFISDISKRKTAEQAQERLQAQLIQSQKMESVGRLAGGVAHDFNNLLTVILGHLDMVIEGLPFDSPLRNDLLEVQKAACHSAQLTRQLLSFARKQAIAPKVLELNSTVQSMFNMLRRLIGEDIELSWKPGEGLWPVFIDPSQMDQILANLCVNARDAISGTGKIVVETKNCCFDADYAASRPDCVPGDYVMLSVSDTGCGIDPKALSHIFEPFYTTKVVGSGTGLGLATVYGAVIQNNGFINVYSELGQGSTFQICLPRHYGELRQVAIEPRAVPLASGRETILVVEDDPRIMSMIKAMLQRLGYVVLAAMLPDEAVRNAQEHPEIHLLLTDVIMPKMNGRDLARTIQSIHPNLRCLYMSGYTADVIATKGVLDEGVNFIQKPFTRDNLALKIREVLDSPFSGNSPKGNAS